MDTINLLDNQSTLDYKVLKRSLAGTQLRLIRELQSCASCKRGYMTRKMTEWVTCAFAGWVACAFVGLAAPGAAWADGAVYAMTNALGDNEIKVYQRATDGTLTLTQTIATGGGGSGIQLDPTDSLGSQGSIVLDLSHGRLFAVNTETDSGDCQKGTISSFRVASDGRLMLAGVVPSGGLFPNSLTVQGNRLYVLNAGGPGLCGIGPNITGFKIQRDGALSSIGASTRPLDPGPSPGFFLNCDPGGFPPAVQCGLNPPAFPRSPGQVRFTPDGNALIVTVKGPNSIYVFPLDASGVPGTPTITQAQGPNQPTYFGFDFDGGGHLIVAEPFGATPIIPAAPYSAVSSFAVTAGGGLQAISSSVPNGRGTSCWVALDPHKRYAYTSNNATSDISAYAIAQDGSLTLLAATAATADLPNDMAVAHDRGGNFLYVLNGGSGTVGGFGINRDGSLTSVGEFDGVPANAGAQGLAAY
jgi:6-phosphogluconolactonase